MSNSLRPRGLQRSRLPCPSLSPGSCWNLCLLSLWSHPTISSSVTHFSICLQSFPASGSFLMSWLFPSGDQIIWASVSASVLPLNIQGWFPLGLTGLVSLLPKLYALLFIFNWSIVDLQCCFSFRCKAQWFKYIYIYTYIHIKDYICLYPFTDSFHLQVITKYWM